MFDPNLPQANTEIDAVQMRAQLTSLNDDIQTRATTADVNTAITNAVADKVTASQLTTAINTTAQNPSSVQPISGSFSDPVSAGDLNTVKDKVNELIAALFRAP